MASLVDRRQGTQGEERSLEAAPPGPALSTPYCRAVLEFEGENGLVRFTGALLDVESAPLAPFLDKVHASLLERGCREVTLDFRSFEMMSPVAFNAFVNWVLMLETMRSPIPYRLRLLTAPERSWQRVALYVLQGLGGDVLV